MQCVRIRWRQLHVRHLASIRLHVFIMLRRRKLPGGMPIHGLNRGTMQRHQPSRRPKDLCLRACTSFVSATAVFTSFTLAAAVPAATLAAALAAATDATAAAADTTAAPTSATAAPTSAAAGRPPTTSSSVATATLDTAVTAATLAAALAAATFLAALAAAAAALPLPLPQLPQPQQHHQCLNRGAVRAHGRERNRRHRRIDGRDRLLCRTGEPPPVSSKTFPDTLSGG